MANDGPSVRGASMNMFRSGIGTILEARPGYVMRSPRITVVLGFLVLFGVACSTGNKPLDPPFESLIPKCEYFAPLFDSAKARMITKDRTGVLEEAPRRCSGNHKELIILF